MILHRIDLDLTSTTGMDCTDVTDAVREVVRESRVEEGQVLVFTPGSTAGVTAIEYEPGCLADLERVFEEIAPRDASYAHNEAWGDGNGYSHVRAALLGPSLTVPLAGGRLMLGTWQQILVVDFDNKPRRRRRVVVQVMGDPPAPDARAG